MVLARRFCPWFLCLDGERGTRYRAYPPTHAHTTSTLYYPPRPLCLGQRGHHSAPTGQCTHHTLHPLPLLAAAVMPTVRIFAAMGHRWGHRWIQLWSIAVARRRRRAYSYPIVWRISSVRAQFSGRRDSVAASLPSLPVGVPATMRLCGWVPASSWGIVGCEPGLRTPTCCHSGLTVECSGALGSQFRP